MTKRKQDEVFDLTLDDEAPPKISKPTRPNYTGESYFLNALDNMYPNLSTVKLEDIFEAKFLKSLFLSTYTLDMQYLVNLVPRKDIPMTIVKHWVRSNGEKAGIFQLSDRVVVCHPKMDQYGSVHSKLWLLEFEGFMRVVVTSGNMTVPDWTVYIQTVWIQDFPKTNKIVSCEFLDVLSDFWRHTTHELPSDWFKNYDFSQSKVHLVPSIPGWHNGKNVEKYGTTRINSLLKKYNYSGNPEVGYQMSSIGKLNKNFLPEFCKNLMCKDSKFHIIFPSQQTVYSSRLGKEGAGMSWLDEENYKSDSFPKGNMYDFGVLQYRSLLSHSKILYSFEVVNKNELYGYIMTGSHNFGGAALGKIQKNGTQIQIYNYELSVLFPPKKYPNIDKITNSTIPFPIPFQVPPPKYTKDQIPWFINKELN
jgi:tyrosyl-DNA phosphodiesterase-1